MQSGSEAVELLVARDAKEAARKSIEIDQYNKDRNIMKSMPRSAA